MKNSHSALNGYSIMWLYVMFDLPVETKPQRRIANRFRKDLIKDGFVRYQFSVYIRPCASSESVAVHISRVKDLVPEEGMVSILRVTDTQFGQTINFVGKKAIPPKKQPIQLELF